MSGDIDFRNYTLLIIDDNPNNLGVAVSALESFGATILVSRSGESGLQRAAYAQPNIILLDVLMPDIDGFETCRRLKANPKTEPIPVIFMTALTSNNDKVKGLEVGAVDYVTKPIYVDELLARVKVHLQLYALNQTLQTQNNQLKAEIEQRITTEKTLTETIDQLKNTQSQLIESEKMAALGNLVAGVAHEISTPIGTSITAASTLADETQTFLKAVEQGQVKRSVFSRYIHVAKSSSKLVLSNLHRAGDLVRSFKLVAVDQSHQEQREFNVKSYLQEVVNSLRPQLKNSKHQLLLTGDDSLVITSYPGLLAQIVTNLVTNSLTHAYQPSEPGLMQVDIQKEFQGLQLIYSDDGCGIPPEKQRKIFEPFYTTARDRGGTGLGLHIVYNLVTQSFSGKIKVDSQAGKGTKFLISLPQELLKSE
ncbi:ATP-binding protein [Acaryochloris marina]|uniref:hybrid sensor histidine kinase/response regulator n=1 Tax=Acaryochloris marina TaxID=155978 RepID=UPI001BB0BA4F|nr:ATP-binding protein [Acaryochloris marina]QUY44898.1 response regulator [Acaryochloris marina S15]